MNATRPIGILFWCLAGPAALYGLLMVVGETIEHFAP
jgi:hypothetical protein